MNKRGMKFGLSLLLALVLLASVTSVAFAAAATSGLWVKQHNGPYAYAKSCTLLYPTTWDAKCTWGSGSGKSYSLTLCNDVGSAGTRWSTSWTANAAGTTYKSACPCPVIMGNRTARLTVLNSSGSSYSNATLTVKSPY